MTEPLPPDGKVGGLISAVKGLTLANVLVIFLLSLIVVPGYIVYRALNDAAVLDRLLSTYKEYPAMEYGCTLREVQQRGSAKYWGISAGFDYQGSDRWQVSVILTHEPNPREGESYCATLKLIVDAMVRNDGTHQ